MSVCAVLLVKDEADILGHTLSHLLKHVDEILLRDNNSSDGSTEIMQAFAAEYDNVIYQHDPHVPHYQSRKMTALALQAFERGHRWVLPIDPDEIWYAPEGRSIRDWLDAVGRETQFVKAAIYNHVCTSRDPLPACPGCGSGGPCCVYKHQGSYLTPDGWPYKLDPVERIGWRQRVPLDIRWGKVACRCRPDLMIENGNHDARTAGVGTTGYGLEIRHFPYRSQEQFVKKAVSCYNGLKAAVGESEGTGAHCRAYGQAIEEGGVEAGYAWFNDAFWSEHPEADSSLVYDPAPSA